MYVIKEMMQRKEEGKKTKNKDYWEKLERSRIRRKEATLGQEDGDKHLIVSRNFTKLLSNVIVLLLSKSIELCFIPDGENGNPTVVLYCCYRVCHGCRRRHSVTQLPRMLGFE